MAARRRRPPDQTDTQISRLCQWQCQMSKGRRSSAPWVMHRSRDKGSHSRSCDAVNLSFFRFLGRCCNEIFRFSIELDWCVVVYDPSRTPSVPSSSCIAVCPECSPSARRMKRLQGCFPFPHQKLMCKCATDRLSDQSDG